VRTPVRIVSLERTTVSHSVHYDKPERIHPKDAQRIVKIALSIIEQVKEPNPNVKTMAVVIVNDFSDIVASCKKPSFMECISQAKLLSAPAPNQPSNLGYTLGSNLAAKALDKAAIILMKKGSVSKAVNDINRTIAGREPSRAGRQKAESTTSSRSYKPRYNRHQPGKAQRRKAA
jgi:hypothetical protein